MDDVSAMGSQLTARRMRRKSCHQSMRAKSKIWKLRLRGRMRRLRRCRYGLFLSLSTIAPFQSTCTYFPVGTTSQDGAQQRKQRQRQRQGVVLRSQPQRVQKSMRKLYANLLFMHVLHCFAWKLFSTVSAAHTAVHRLQPSARKR